MDNHQEHSPDGQEKEASSVQKRAWVTPAFEQVALKDALNGATLVSANDGIADSS